MSGTIDGPRGPVAGASADPRSGTSSTIHTTPIESDVIVVGAGPGRFRHGEPPGPPRA